MAAGTHCGRSQGQATAVLLRLDRANDMDRLRAAFQKKSSLLDSLADDIEESPRMRNALKRLQSQGRITLLIDGLDHVLGQDAFVQNLAALVNSPAWRNCPVWIAGRPAAFRHWWNVLFASPAWKILHVDPLAKPEIRFFLSEYAGADSFKRLSEGSRRLLSVPGLH